MNKTHAEAMYDGTIDTMKTSEVRKLIGFYEPGIQESAPVGATPEWHVTTNDGGIYTAKDQATAHIISQGEQILALLVRMRGR